ncbi:FixH family protein [Mariprofundus sp. NF]|uniref:FixH family protein n=1 Tax=Mariprofundus sp. NF TaxID=2608716 RepID=UPI0015A4E4AC|nr:FixH family protein [Mariprofundus sp. NF]NWF38545.1 FixH family protein [Mariprofundus sp. NF]
MAAELHLKEDFRNPWFLGILGLVGAALAATIWMAVIAGQTSPGLVSEDYYEKGSNYFNKTPEQKNLPQWRLNLMTPDKPVVGQSQTYRLYAVMESGKPVSSASVTLYAYRPSDANADFKLTMQQRDPGSFSVVASFPLPGTWDLIAQIQADGKQFDVVQRIFVGN